MYQKTLISNAKFRLNREKEKSGQWKREIIGVSFLSDSDHWFQLGYPRNEVALFQILVLMSCFDKVSVLMLHLALQSWLMLRRVLDIEGKKKANFFLTSLMILSQVAKLQVGFCFWFSCFWFDMLIGHFCLLQKSCACGFEF